MDMGEFYLPSREPSYVVMSEASGRPYYVSSRPRVVELLVPMCCTKCEEKVREILLELEGVQGLVVDPTTQRVTVTGYVDPLRTLRKARKVKRDAQLLSGDRLMTTSTSAKHGRCEYRPSSSTYSTFVQQPTSEYHTSFYRHSDPQSYYGYNHVMGPSYDEMVITNPRYVNHVQAPEYWS